MPVRRAAATSTKAHYSVAIFDIQLDATEFDLPQAPCVVYIYNSFRGPVLAAVLDRIQRSVLLFPRHIRIAYVEPTLPELFLQVPGIQIFKDKQRYFLYDLGDLN
jgi:hypothetical protein